MIYTIEMFRRFKAGDITDIIYATTDKEDAMEFFNRQCKSSDKEKFFVEYSIYEWEKPLIKVLLDTWNNGYLKKKKKNETVHDD